MTDRAHGVLMLGWFVARIGAVCPMRMPHELVFDAELGPAWRPAKSGVEHQRTSSAESFPLSVSTSSLSLLEPRGPVLRRACRRLAAAAFLACGLSAAQNLAAQVPSSQVPSSQTSSSESTTEQEPRVQSSANPKAQVLRIDRSQAPVLDGDLDETIWGQATPIGGLTTVEPVDGLQPSEGTRVRILQDGETLWMAIECMDSDPHGIRATQRARDANLNPDDRVEWFFDTFHNRRRAYWFQVGAAGSLGDSLIGPSSFNKDFDTIWDGRVRRTPRGWQAEVAIPFRSLGFAEGQDTWGFNLRRLRRTANEEYRWANARQGQRFFTVAEAGELGGLQGASQGLGLDVVPFVSVGATRSRQVDASYDVDPDAGGDVFYRITPSLVASITAYTDFAETENDSPQINLGRFPLFFPEKRDFFLKDAGQFRFGNGSRDFRPFFSRRIGLDGDGREIPLLFGAKLAGEAGPWRLGVLGVHTDKTVDVSSRKTLGVARAQYAVAEQTTVGAIVTHGRPTDSGDNSVVGIDAYHRESNLFWGQDVEAWLFGAVSNTDGPDGDGNGFGGRVSGRGRETQWQLETLWVGDQFNPELGFVPRRGIKQYGASFEWEPRPEQPSAIRNYEFEFAFEGITDEGNRITDLTFDLDSLGIEFDSGDSVFVGASREFERIDESFLVFNDQALIEAGDYWQNGVVAGASTSEGRALSGSARASYGDFFSGDSTSFETGIDWRASALFTAGASVEVGFFELPGVRFNTVTAEGRADLQFSPRLGVTNLVQYENESGTVALQSRLRWLRTPRSELFVVLNLSWREGADLGARPVQEGLVAKLVQTFRF